MDKISSGKLGEEKAARFLQTQGYKIIAMNFKARYGEIDIVAQDKDILVFVEVKTRTNYKFGRPEESITPWKLREVIKTAQYYKLLNPKTPELMRIDMVAVDEVEGTIKHFKNISQ